MTLVSRHTSQTPGFSSDASPRVVPGTELQHGIFWITFRGGTQSRSSNSSEERPWGHPSQNQMGFRHSLQEGLETLPPTYYVTVGTWSGLAVEVGLRLEQTSVVTPLA